MSQTGCHILPYFSREMLSYENPVGFSRDNIPGLANV
jgi:hypothetical protein